MLGSHRDAYKILMLATIGWLVLEVLATGVATTCVTVIEDGCRIRCSPDNGNANCFRLNEC